MSEPTYSFPFTKEQIQAALQAVIFADSSPTTASTNTVSSSGVKTYVDALIAIAAAGRDALDVRVDALEAVPQATGWELHADSTYTTGARLTVNNTVAPITIDKSGADQNVTYSPLDAGSFFSNNLFTPPVVGDAYSIRLSFKAQAASTDSWFDLGLDISAAKDRSNVVLLDTVTMTKGTTEMVFTKNYTIFALDTILANGGQFYIDTAVSANNVDFWDFQLLVSRTHTPNV